jgi:1-phosphatidylinositol-3-phosphate 5-kinase
MSVPAAHQRPFYLREHCKRILRGALWNDSKFLANLNIMDYSVLVAVDSVKNELVIGIVGEYFGVISDSSSCLTVS